MSKSSTVNTRMLAHNLLTAIQTRGTHSSGFSYVKGEQTAVYKRAVPGSELALHELPRRSDAVILHTRFATQGKVSDNRNNHPVISPGGNIALVHNGVISNDHDFRYGPDGFKNLPAVDTAVIPALIESHGVKDGVSLLEGYAAISWLDSRNKDSRLHLARLDFSPVAFTWLLDGSYVFASTVPLLAGALAYSGLDHGHIFEMPEEQYVQVVNGVIMESEDEIKMLPDWWTQRQFASSTAGGHGSESGTTNVYGIGSSFGNVAFDDDDYDSDMSVRTGRWNDDYRSRVTTDPGEAAMAFEPESNERRQVWKPNADGELEMAYTVGPGEDREPELQGFYVELEDGSLEYCKTVGDMEKVLEDLSKLDLWESAPFPTASRALRWTNFVTDIGEITKSRGMDSWLADFGMLDEHESRGVYNLQYIREGMNDIVTMQSI
jgi:hypothetical protein